ncbi:MAG: hypothetical protein AB7J40_04890 [Candidatus Altimarinota bacterium]
MKTSHKVLFGGVILGIMLISLVRFFFMPGHAVTHFHANFAMFINGERVDLTDDKYMEDVQGCKPEYIKVQPEERTHMHENNHDVVHVHDDGVTWGHFMANIGFAFGSSYLITDEDQIFRNENGRTVKYILNGVQVNNPFNRLMQSEDRFLISYGDESVDQVLSEQFSVVAADAHEHNEHPDPGSCSGTIELGFWEKLKKAVLF